MSTIFIAVQCCQCLTMQVKQQKKSSNKWNCVICDQKQSVLKVFAQGFKARDVRKFVQGFNMSRKLVEENEDETPIPPFEEIDDPTLRKISHERKRRNDWMEYLDFEDTDRKEEEPEKVFASEPEIVTELPKEMFKKPKPKNYTTGLDNMEGNKPLKPVFSKRMAKPIIPQEKEEARECQTITAKGASKWSNYLTLEDEEDELLFEGGRRDLPDSGESWCQTLLQTHFNDQRVEDDVHPDFK